MRKLFHPGRPAGRLFYCLISVLVAVGASRGVPPPPAPPATTIISDVIYRADGSTAAGTLLITWPAFTTADNRAVPAGSLSLAIGPFGAINLALVPNQGATPAGTYYKVVIKLNDGTTSEEFWVVPTLSPTSISAIRSQVVPQGVALQVVTRQYVDGQLATKADNAAAVHRSGDETVDGVKQFTSSPEVPTPTTDAAAANKAYADSAVSTVGDNLYVRKSGDAMTGTLTAPGLTSGKINNVRFALAGADWCARVNAAIADGLSTGVLVEAFGLEAGQTCASNPFAGVTKPVSLRGPGKSTVTSSAAWALPSNLRLHGLGDDRSEVKFSAGSPLDDCAYSSAASAISIRDLRFTGTGTCSRVFSVVGSSDVRFSSVRFAGATVVPGSGPLAGLRVDTGSSDIWVKDSSFADNGPLSGTATGFEFVSWVNAPNARIHVRDSRFVGRNTEQSVALADLNSSDAIGNDVDQGNRLGANTLASGYCMSGYGANAAISGLNYSLNNLRNCAGTGMYFAGLGVGTDKRFALVGNIIFDAGKQQSAVSLPVGSIAAVTLSDLVGVGNIMDTSGHSNLALSTVNRAVFAGQIGTNATDESLKLNAVTDVVVTGYVGKSPGAQGLLATGTSSNVILNSTVMDSPGHTAYLVNGALNDSILSSNIASGAAVGGVHILGGNRNLILGGISRDSAGTAMDYRGQDSILALNLLTGTNGTLDTTGSAGCNFVLFNYLTASPLSTTRTCDVVFGNREPGGSDITLYTGASGSVFGMDILGRSGAARNLLRVQGLGLGSNGFTVTTDGSRHLYTFNDGPLAIQGAGSYVRLGEAAAPSSIAGSSVVWADATSHRVKVRNNGASADSLALFSDKLNVFAATTSSELAGAISDETGSGGSGKLMFNNAPVLSSFTVGGLPAAGTADRIAIVTDAATAGSCTSGGGSNRALCRDTGAAWEPLGDGGGGGGGANPALSNLASVAVNAALIPGADGTLDLGSSSLSWKSLYAKGAATLGPAIASFDANSQGYLSIAQHSMKSLNSATAGNRANLINVFQDNNASNSVWAVYSLAEATNTSGTKSSVTGTGSDAYLAGPGGTAGALLGYDTYAQQNSGTTVSGYMAGFRNYIQINSGATATAAAYGLYSQGINLDAAITVPTMAGVRIDSNTKSAGTITNNFGLDIADQTAGATNYAIRTGAGLVSLGDTTSAPIFDAGTGFRIAGAAGSGNVLRGNGSNFVSATLACADVANCAGLAASGTAGVGPSKAGAASTAARSDHDHRSVHTLTWFFPGTPSTGVSPMILVVPQGIANGTITGMQVTVATPSSSSSTFNIQRCTASCTGTSPTFANIYSSDNTLSANASEADFGTTNLTTSLNAKDQFKANLGTIGSGLANVTITLTYKYDTTN